MAKALDVTMSACLEALDRGESVDSILSRYPAMATELRPFLETAVFLKHQPTNPTIAAKSASLTAMKKEAARLRPQKRSGFALFFHRARRFSPAMALFGLMIVLFMATIAPPDSPLYGARLFLDGLRGNQQENDGTVDVVVEETAVSPTIIAPTVVSVTAVSPSPTVANTVTSIPSLVITSTLTATPSPTATISATITPSPTATMTQTPTPSLTPSPTLMLPTETVAPQPPAPTAISDDDDDDDDDESEDHDESDEPDEPGEDEEDEEPDEPDETKTPEG